MTVEQAIKEVDFLIKGYTDLTDNRRIYPECHRILDALLIAKESLENQRQEADWIVCDDDLYLKCTCCDNIILLEEASPYCPECGAEMRKVKGNQNGRLSRG